MRLLPNVFKKYTVLNTYFIYKSYCRRKWMLKLAFCYESIQLKISQL